MRITYIAAGAGKMFCGTCLRDGALAAALMRLGHDVTLVPTYTPLRIEGEDISVDRLFLGGINVYLQDKLALFRHTPRFIDRVFDSPALVQWASGFGHMTTAADLAHLTISMLEGERGHQLKEVHRLTTWLAQQPRPDVILLPNTMLAGVGLAISHSLNVPVLSFVSGEDGFIEEFPEPWRGRTRRALHHQARQCNGLIAHNMSYARHMAEFLDVPLELFRIAPLGIETGDYLEHREKERNGDGAMTIGFLARICPQKGLHDLAQAFRILKRESANKNLRLKVAGYLAPEYKGYLDAIRRDMREWGFENSFEYVGELERPAKLRFLQSLDLFCVPSLYPEAKAQFAPEALAAGVPIIAPRVGGLVEWVEQTGGGILVERDGAESLAKGIADMIGRDGQAAAMGRSGREAVMSRHTTAKMAEAVAGILGEVVGQNGR